MLLAGTGVAFAWVLLSFALGFSASQTHAEEDPGLLGAVASTVDETTSQQPPERGAGHVG